MSEEIKWNNISKNNSEVLYLSKDDLNRNKSKIKIIKTDFKNKSNYINFLVVDTKDFYFFTPEGEIHNYKFNKNNIFKFKRIITNNILCCSVINICQFKNDNYLLITNQYNLINLDLKNQTMTELYTKNIGGVKFKMKIFEYEKNLNCILFEDENYINFYSLDNYSLIKKFSIYNTKYNIIIINNNPKIL